jgi:hypothetical protein
MSSKNNRREGMETESYILHIIPINDLIEHEENSKCQCNPTAEVIENGYILITHNAKDGRN